MAEAAIAFGSNIGDRAQHIARAIDHLTRDDEIELVGLSHLYETEPWGDASQGRYINACALVETDLGPHDLLARCLAVEESLGRVRDPANRYGPRTIDLDLIYYEDIEIHDERLTLPHPHLFERGFVLIPLAEVVGERFIGVRSVAEAARLADASGIKRYQPQAAPPV
jgi:2-amino-4-hydroxy-6-hydroxymethyldihydropteridine diphosphokinase